MTGERGDTRSLGFNPEMQSSRPQSPGDFVDKRFEILEEIGSGGMARVYRARHLVFDSEMALKILSYSGAQDRVIRERFLEEARILFALDHPNVLRVYDAGVSLEGSYFVATELLRGETLGAWLEHIRPEERDIVFIRRLLCYLDELCEGLIEAHERRVVHRDLKPSNMYLQKDEDNNVTAKLIDFGLARSSAGATSPTEASCVVGTEAYMSPEQKAGCEPDARSDVYSLGVVLYEALTGHLPVRVDRDPVFMRARNEVGVVRPPSELNPNVPARLDRVCAVALERDPANRYPSAVEFVRALRQALPSIPSESGRAAPASGRRMARVGVLAAVVVVVLALGAWATSFLKEARPSPAPTRAVASTSVTLSAKPAEPATPRPTPASTAVVVPASLSAPTDHPELPVAKSSRPRNEPREVAAVAGGRAGSEEKDVASLEKLLDEGMKALGKANLADAERMFDEATRVDAHSAEAWYGLGKVALERDQYGLAVERLETALRYRNSARMRIELGSAFLSAGRREDAMAAWQKVIELFPNDAKACGLARKLLAENGAR